MALLEEFYRSRMRHKGQLTVPAEIRAKLGVDEGDDLIFHVDAKGRVVLERARIIPPDQAWFWENRWQQMEKEIQEDAEAGHLMSFDSANELVDYLDSETLSDVED